MISKQELKKRVTDAKSQAKEALETLYNELNRGQRKKVLRNPDVKKWLIFYGIVDEE